MRVDVLERVGTDEEGQPTWRLIEVKSSTRQKPTHLDDLTIQSYVLQGAGVRLAEICLMHVEHPVCKPDGCAIDLEALFSIRPSHRDDPWPVGDG
ncbi:MAG: hypothetical protein U0361_05955 [Nitrospiraceae bacterium]